MAFSSTRTNRKRQKQLQKIKISLLLVFLLIIGFIALLRLDFWTIDRIELNGLLTLDKALVEKIVKDTLDGSDLLVLPRDNILRYPKDEIIETLLVLYPQIKDVTILRTDLDAIVVSVQERQVLYQYCGLESCFRVDAEGILFLNAERESFDFTFESYQELVIGDELLPPQELRSLVIFINSLQDLGLDVLEVFLTESHNVSITVAGDTKILVNQEKTYDEVYTYLVKLFDQNDFTIDRESGAFVQDFDYINARFGNRLFYCLKGDICEGNY